MFLINFKIIIRFNYYFKNNVFFNLSFIYNIKNTELYFNFNLF
jgi:hypothetical protein